jgi:DNA repair protein RadC
MNTKKQKTPKTIAQYTIKKITEAEGIPQIKITSSETAYNVIRQFWHDDIGIYESFFILLLNRANVTIGWAKISQGGITGTVVDTKIVVKYAIDSLASGIILAHNHPSGNLEPSQQDKEVTEKIKKAAGYIDTKVLDHLILTPDNKYFSFLDHGLL